MDFVLEVSSFKVYFLSMFLVFSGTSSVENIFEQFLHKSFLFFVPSKVYNFSITQQCFQCNACNKILILALADFSFFNLYIGKISINFNSFSKNSKKCIEKVFNFSFLLGMFCYPIHCLSFKSLVFTVLKLCL